MGEHLRAAYDRISHRAGGRWHSLVTIGDETVISDDPDYVVEGASVQKLAVALAVLDAVDTGDLSLSEKIELRDEDILEGAGLYSLQPVRGDQLTLANVLVHLLAVSDNSAVRMVGRLIPGPRINALLASKGFEATRVDPLPDNPHRFWLGTTTPRETHMLLRGLSQGSYLSEDSSTFLLDVLRGGTYHDGIRRHLSSAERARVATKGGQDEDRRHEVGIISPITYCFFADQHPDWKNYGGSHPVVMAHAELGRLLFDALP